jgi:hypothetical protein
MSRRRVQLVILCEDRQHAAFVRRFVEASGWGKRQIEVILNPEGRDGRGSGEQWVRERYAREVRKLRAAPHVAKALIVMIDEDTQGVGHRDTQLAKALEERALAARGAAESVLHIVPARSIETWLEYLKGETVDELGKKHFKLARERDCAPMVDALKGMCDARKLRAPAPASLTRACDEYRTRMP